MAQTKLKDKLYEKLVSIEDDVLIQSVLDLIDLEGDQITKIHFNENQLNLIKQAKLSVRKNGISNEEVFKKTRQWLKK